MSLLTIPEGNPGEASQESPREAICQNQCQNPTGREARFCISDRWRKLKRHQGHPQVYNATDRQIIWHTELPKLGGS